MLVPLWPLPCRAERWCSGIATSSAAHHAAVQCCAPWTFDMHVATARPAIIRASSLSHILLYSQSDQCLRSCCSPCHFSGGHIMLTEPKIVWSYLTLTEKILQAFGVRLEWGFEASEGDELLHASADFNRQLSHPVQRAGCAGLSSPCMLVGHPTNSSCAETQHRALPGPWP